MQCDMTREVSRPIELGYETTASGPTTNFVGNHMTQVITSMNSGILAICSQGLIHSRCFQLGVCRKVRPSKAYIAGCHRSCTNGAGRRQSGRLIREAEDLLQDVSTTSAASSTRSFNPSRVSRQSILPTCNHSACCSSDQVRQCFHPAEDLDKWP